MPSAYQEFQVKTFGDRNNRLKADMEKLIANANAELNLSNKKLYGQ